MIGFRGAGRSNLAAALVVMALGCDGRKVPRPEESAVGAELRLVRFERVGLTEVFRADLVLERAGVLRVHGTSLAGEDLVAVLYQDALGYRFAQFTLSDFATVRSVAVTVPILPQVAASR